jgi:aspartate aminotransferase
MTYVEHLSFDEIKRTRPSKYAGLDNDIISLGLAESDFEMPKEVKEAIINAINNGRYHYEFGGVVEFLDAAKDKLHRFNKIPVESDEILPTVGGMNGIWLAYRILLKPGERVIVVTPTYPPIIHSPKSTSQADTIEVRTKENGHIDTEAIKMAISDKTKMISICNPNNPTGAVYNREELEQLAEIAKRHELYVFSDELYENLTYDGREHVSIASLDGMLERTVTVFGFTKTYGMSGLRIGYVVASREVIERMKGENGGIVIHPGTLEQIGAAAALKKCDYYVEHLKEYLANVRNRLIRSLREVSEIKAPLPEGTFFAFPDLSALFEDDDKAVEYLRNVARVVVSGGSGYGNGGAGHIRINFCSPAKIIDEASERIRNALRLLTRVEFLKK